MKFISFLSRPVLGLDVQESEIKIAVLRKTLRKHSVAALIRCALPAGICVDGKIKEWNDLSFIVKNIIKEHGLSGLVAAVALPANLVRIQKIDVARELSPDAIEAEISVQLQRDLPGMKENLCIDYFELPTNSDTSKGLLFAAAREEYINQYVSCIAGAGLELRSIGIDSYSLRRFLRRFVMDPAKINAIFHLNNLYALLVVFSMTEIIFQQRWNVKANENVWYEVQNKLQIFAVLHPNVKINQLIFHNERCADQFDNEIKLARIPNITFVDPFEHYVFAHPASQVDKNDFLLAASCA